MLSSIISVSLLATSTYALAFNGPRATPVNQIFGDLLNHPGPRPTAAPSVDIELLKRQNVVTDLLAPDNTCGFISGKPDAAYYCYSTTDTCAFFPTTAGYGFVGCCNNVNCGARLTCVDSSQFYSQTFCDNACQKGTFTLKCTKASAPYCNGIRWPSEGIQDYFCDSVTVSTWQTALTTYVNQKGRSFSPLTVTLTTTGSTIDSTGTDGLLVPTASSSKSSSAGSTTSLQSTAQAASTTSGSPGPTPEASKKSTPVGAIAGGTVGGIAVLAGAIIGVWFLLRKKKTKAADAHNSVPPPSYAPQNDTSAYAAAAAGKPTPTAQEAQYTGQYGPQGQQGYSPVPQQYQQPYGQQQYGQPPMQQMQNQNYAPPLAEAPGSTSYGVAGGAALGAGAGAAAAYDPHHSTGPQTPYSQHSQPLTPNSAAPQPLSPNSAAHLSAAYPDRSDATSPVSQHRLSTNDGSSPQIGGNSQYQAYTPYVPPTAQGNNPPVEMMTSNAGPWPTNLHEGTWEAPGPEHRGHQ